MSDNPSEMSPLARLVLAMICLAAAGSILAGVHYAAVDLPKQHALEAYTRCIGGCVSSNVMISTPLGPRNPTDDTCHRKCRHQYLSHLRRG